ncbi:hypothetical protein [Amycolatopsis tucumanensis]|uniref:hypothetical protein n=1 Tax=Amycolatopsis tucumanensis TaxID=401106 RepID=UPI003D762F5A
MIGVVQAGGRRTVTPAVAANLRQRPTAALAVASRLRQRPTAALATAARSRLWITIAPADAANLRHRLGEMLVSAAGETLAPGGAW